MKKMCDCIIPFYNEGKKPLYVAEMMSKVRNFSRIIAVDDGSTDTDTYDTLHKQFPQIHLVRLEKNTGKTNAVREGLTYVNAPFVFLADSDLSHINTKEFENAIECISSNQKIDMIILPLVDDLLHKDWFRWYTIFSGQRVLSTTDLRTICQQPISGFQLEAVINDYMIKSRKNSVWMRSLIKHQSKYDKWGNIGGIKKVLSLVGELRQCIGLYGIIKQTLFFCRIKAP